ncbi:DNA sulfur modification protein DndE [Brevundimonas sp.]|jgi:DNA sulfur modification protein DndE|uniref:DNA sulfur modification protein DndE n=1 Tax=Brevundimonas sp. TaxID=1871086 RepID=UPI0037BF79A9
MAIETVRIDEQGREQLIRLKRHTGVDTWNVLCRWAFCASLAEKTRPPMRLFKGEPAVEIAWRVFGGAHHELYLALLKQRLKQDGYELNDSNLQEQFRLHLHRGLGYLAANRAIRSIEGLATMPKQHAA